jgi:hypothetical protein
MELRRGIFPVSSSMVMMVLLLRSTKNLSENELLKMGAQRCLIRCLGGPMKHVNKTSDEFFFPLGATFACVAQFSVCSPHLRCQTRRHEINK